MGKYDYLLQNQTYLSANDATKSAIFDKLTSADPEYQKLNDATKSAIRQKYQIGVVPKTPDAPAKADTPKDAPKEPEEKSWFSKTFGHDSSKMGFSGLGAYANAASSGAITGGATGAGLGALAAPFTEGVSIPFAAAEGAGLGAIGGVVEQGVHDLGFGKGTQMAAGMLLSPSKGMTKSAVGLAERAVPDAAVSAVRATARKAAGLVPESVKDAAEVAKGAAGGVKDIGKYMVSHKVLGPAAYRIQKLKPEPKIDAAALERATGQRAEQTMATVGSKHADAAREAVQLQHGTSSGSGVYEIAKRNYDDLMNQGQHFTKSQEFKNLVNSYPEATRGAMKNKLESLFKGGKGKSGYLTGDDVINNLQGANLANKLTPSQGSALTKSLNDFMERHTGHAYESEARAAYGSIAQAQALDALPLALKNAASRSADSADARKFLAQNMENYGKTPQSRAIFWKEAGHAMQDMPVSDAQNLWNTMLRGNIERHFNLSAAQKDALSKAMNTAKTKRDLSNFVRLLTRATVSVKGAKDENYEYPTD